jgi:inward rectifier potassium channel
MRLPQTRQRVDVGGTTAYKIGTPGVFTDLYYTLMEMGWGRFFALGTATFLGVNLVFGLIYAALPGAVYAMQPGSIVDGFFFSVDTFGTVGYGVMAPATHLGHAVATIEILVGLFLTATLTGIIFARFSRPRETILFSDVAVIASHFGQRSLMVRVASARSRPLVEVRAEMVFLRRTITDEGRPFRRYIDLPLMRRTNPLMALAWTVIHNLEEGSPLCEAIDNGEEIVIVVSLNGLDTLLGQPAFGGHTYREGDLRQGQRFTDLITERDGITEIDIARLHQTEPEPA